MAASVKLVENVREKVSDAEWAVRVDLAAAYRLVAFYGWDDMIFTHLSARAPGPEHHFLINPYNLMFDEITASSLVKIDVDGMPVIETPYITNPAGFTIHSAIHMARDDAKAVMHLHTPYGQAVSAMKMGLLPHTQTAMIAHHNVAYHDYEGVATDLEERARLVADIADKKALILRNHGTLAVGETVGDCFVRLYFLERACEAQVHMLAAGRDGLNDPKEGVNEKVAQQSRPQGMARLAERLAWPALLRKLDRSTRATRTEVGPAPGVERTARPRSDRALRPVGPGRPRLGRISPSGQCRGERVETKLRRRLAFRRQ